MMHFSSLAKKDLLQWLTPPILHALLSLTCNTFVHDQISYNCSTVACLYANNHFHHGPSSCK
ncbi:hypothetical protein Sjap_025101 [Stephania japonica]|uniref:Uncharacterized protein n=1 Tax=Stephania japonica TaxID=461633 RepID=A0AAP0HJA1_9MAGN